MFERSVHGFGLSVAGFLVCGIIACMLAFSVPQAFAADNQALQSQSIGTSQLTAATPAKPAVKKAKQVIKTPQDVYSVAAKRPLFGILAKAKTKLSFKSSDPSIAKVSSKGKVTVGAKTGIAFITITARETSKYKAATKKVKVRVSNYKATNGRIAHSTGNHDGRPGDFHNHDSRTGSYWNMGWNFIIRCRDPYIADHASVAARYIVQNPYFGYNGRFPKSQESVNARASIYSAIVKVTGKNPDYKQLQKIKSVKTIADTSCTPSILAGYWLYYDMADKLNLKWYPPYNKKAYSYYCGAPNVEYHQLETCIRHVNEKYMKAGKLCPFEIIYVPKGKRSSFFSKSNIKKNLKRGDIVCCCPNPNRNGHSIMML